MNRKNTPDTRGCIIAWLQTADANSVVGSRYQCLVPAMLGAVANYKIGVCGRAVQLREGGEGLRLDVETGSRPCAASPLNDARIIEDIDPGTFLSDTPLGPQ